MYQIFRDESKAGSSWKNQRILLLCCSLHFWKHAKHWNLVQQQSLSCYWDFLEVSLLGSLLKVKFLGNDFIILAIFLSRVIVNDFERFKPYTDFYSRKLWKEAKLRSGISWLKSPIRKYLFTSSKSAICNFSISSIILHLIARPYRRLHLTSPILFLFICDIQTRE